MCAQKEDEYQTSRTDMLIFADLSISDINALHTEGY